MDTEIDALIKIVQEKGEVSALVLAKQLGMSTKTVEKLGESLANHHLVELKYTFLKGVVFKRVGDGKK
jgi:predicted transcriptional regulator